MKTNLKTILALLTLGAATLTLRAQDEAPPQQSGQPTQDQQGPQGGRHHRPPPSKLLLALDANHDGVIDSNEIANSSAVLTTLASEVGTNGTLTWAEVCPQRPPRPGGNDSASSTNQDNPPPPDGQQGQGQGQGQHHRPPPDKLFTALDANHDGVIDANEIANAPAALKTLDKNGDGQLTRDELRPNHPPRPEGNDNGGNQSGNPDNDRPAGPPPAGQNDGPPPQ